ncbi:MAG: hypothetical protein ACP5UF_00235 [Hydrogenobaculum sp.]
MKSVKHRNHTYYDLSRVGKLLLREYERQVKEINLNLKFPYKR